MYRIIYAYIITSNGINKYAEGIGYKNTIPWNSTVYRDGKYFRETTLNSIVIMGRKTWESIPLKYKPLKNRINIILTKSKKSIHKDNVHIFNSIDDCHEWLQNYYPDWLNYPRWVIGGEKIYKEFLDRNLIYYIDKGHVKIKKIYNCDTFVELPEIYSNQLKIFRGEFIDRYIISQKTDEIQIINLMKEILDKGNSRIDRTGVGTKSIFGKTLTYTMKYNESEDNYTLPLMTTRHMFFRGIFEELMWFLRGQIDSKILEEKGVNVWKGNSTRKYLDSVNLSHLKEGENGPIYGKQWRKWKTYDGKEIDQIMNIINDLKTKPYSRRHILSAWNVAELKEMSLPPCHILYQFYVCDDKISCQFYQRSSDVFLANNWNVISACLLTLLIATQTGFKPHKIIHNIGDAHIYNNLIEQSMEQIKRIPLPSPKIKIINKRVNIEDYQYGDIKLIDYYHYPPIKGVMNS